MWRADASPTPGTLLTGCPETAEERQAGYSRVTFLDNPDFLKIRLDHTDDPNG
jgi:hypothetical protein